MKHSVRSRESANVFEKAEHPFQTRSDHTSSFLVAEILTSKLAPFKYCKVEYCKCSILPKSGPSRTCVNLGRLHKRVLAKTAVFLVTN